MPLRTYTILYPRQNTFGLAKDAAVIQRALATMGGFQKARVADPQEPLIHVDLQIHLEVPVFGAIPWAHTNVLLLNAEHWVPAWDAYVHAFDAVLFRDSTSLLPFKDAWTAAGIAATTYLIPWALADAEAWASKSTKQEFVCFLGGSTNKYEALKALVWRPEDPPLTVFTTRTDFAEGLKGLHATVRVLDLLPEMHQRLASEYAGHVVVSRGESFGYAAAEAEAAGAFAILSPLPVFREMYQEGVAFVNSFEAASEAYHAHGASQRTARQQKARARFSVLVEALRQIPLEGLIAVRKPKGVMHCPPLLHVADCPSITVVTPTYRRKKLFEIAMHNMLSTDYPREKIEWIVIEDCDLSTTGSRTEELQPHMCGEDLLNFQLKAPTLRVKYIPIYGRMTIGEKRNHAVEAATSEIILFMDDDDHYPPTSFRRRVAWLTKGMKKGVVAQTIACCTTLALYDLQRGVSAVNVPPRELPFAQRISEATLTFRKSAWEERRFPDVSVAEGEGWIQGREADVIEMPPQQLIVAFTHGANQTSRRVPASNDKASCFWGFPHEYLVFVHGLVGVEVEPPSTR